MNEKQTPVEMLFEKARDYNNSTIDLLKLNVVDKSADVVSSLVWRLAIFITVALSLLIVNIGIALWVGVLLGGAFYGFFIIGAFYGLFAMLLYNYRYRWIKSPVSNSIIKQMLKKKNAGSVN